MIELASDLFGVSLSIGTVDQICQRASDALAGPHAQLHDWGRAPDESANGSAQLHPG
jgi:hypothetical protein